MDKLQNKFLGVSATIIFVAAIFTSAQTLAQTTLNGMEISSNSRSYDIVLNTDKGTTINKKNVSPDSLELNLKNTKIAKNARTVYKNADGIILFLLFLINFLYTFNKAFFRLCQKLLLTVEKTNFSVVISANIRKR